MTYFTSSLKNLLKAIQSIALMLSLLALIGISVFGTTATAFAQNSPTPTGPCTILKDKTRFYIPNPGSHIHTNIMDYGWFNRKDRKIAYLDIYTENCIGKKVKVGITSQRTAGAILDVARMSASGSDEFLIEDDGSGNGKGSLRLSFLISEEKCRELTTQEIQGNIAQFLKVMNDHKAEVIEIAKKFDPGFDENTFNQFGPSYMEGTILPFLLGVADIQYGNGFDISPVDLFINGAPYKTYTWTTSSFGLEDIESFVVGPGQQIWGNTQSNPAVGIAVNEIATRENIQFISSCDYEASVRPAESSILGSVAGKIKVGRVQYQCFDDEPLTGILGGNPFATDRQCSDGNDEEFVRPMQWTFDREPLSNLANSTGLDSDSPCLDQFGDIIPGCQELLAPLPGFGRTIDDSLSIGKYVNTAFQMVMGFLGLAAVIKIIMGGIKYMTSDTL